MKKKVKVTVYRRANRKYYQAAFRLASGELIERSTKSTNKKEATAIGYEWAKAEMKEFASKQSKKNEVEDKQDTLTIGGVGAYFCNLKHWIQIKYLIYNI